MEEFANIIHHPKRDPFVILSPNIGVGIEKIWVRDITSTNSDTFTYGTALSVDTFFKAASTRLGDVHKGDIYDGLATDTTGTTQATVTDDNNLAFGFVAINHSDEGEAVTIVNSLLVKLIDPQYLKTPGFTNLTGTFGSQYLHPGGWLIGGGPNIIGGQCDAVLAAFLWNGKKADFPSPGWNQRVRIDLRSLYGMQRCNTSDYEFYAFLRAY